MDESGQELLRMLHKERNRTQNERSKLIIQKLTFITIFFGIGSVSMGIRIEDIFWLLYFIPPLAICYDLHLMSSDSRIERIDVFLGRHPISTAGKAEHEWTYFCSAFRDSLFTSANALFTLITTAGAGLFIYSQHIWTHRVSEFWFYTWLIVFMAIIIGLWVKHEMFLKDIGKYGLLNGKREDPFANLLGPN
jgi:hypothetical protein